MRIESLLSAGLVLCATPVFAQVLDPGTAVGGVSQKDWAARWVQRMFTLGTECPMVDLTGAFAHHGDVAPDVFFLSGVFFTNGSPDGSPVFRSASVAESKHLFFPLINGFADNTNYFGQPPTTFTALELLTSGFGVNYVMTMDTASLFATLDGVPLSGLAATRQTWGLTDSGFDITYTNPDNFPGVLGADASLGTGIYPSTVSPTVTDGFYPMLAPLSRGEHTLHFGGRISWIDGSGQPLLDGNGAPVTSSQDITYRLNITSAPEPGTLGLVALGICLCAVRARRRV